jgi:hypothetical protein
MALKGDHLRLSRAHTKDQLSSHSRHLWPDNNKGNLNSNSNPVLEIWAMLHRVRFEREPGELVQRYQVDEHRPKHGGGIYWLVSFVKCSFSKNMREQNIKIDHDRLLQYASWFTILQCLFRDIANSRITNYTDTRCNRFILNATSENTDIGIINFVGLGHEGQSFWIRRRSWSPYRRFSEHTPRRTDGRRRNFKCGTQFLSIRSE